MKFTDRSIQALKAKKHRFEVWEDGVPGFGVRVSPKGRKSWVYLYHFNKRPRRMTFGAYPQIGLAKAHKFLAEAKLKLAEDPPIDPGAIKQKDTARARSAPTVQNLADEYMEKWAKVKKKSWREDERILNKHVLPEWKNIKVEEIKRRDLILLLDDIEAPIQANRVLALVRKMFNFAIDRGILEVTPFTRMKLPHYEVERTRTLTPDEIKTFWNRLDQADIEKRTRLALKFLLVTSQRSTETSTAARSEIDLENRLWTIPGEKTKNGITHIVPLSSLAIEILEEVYKLGGNSDCVFPAKKGAHKPLARGTLSQAVQRNLETFDAGQFTPHDLRRTASTIMKGLVNPQWVEKVLNHLPPKLERTYDQHDYLNEKRQALDAWSRKIESLLFSDDAGAEVILMAGHEKL
ncbi:MAG: tyrosine-type recombinase/integrase [Candidatus Scalindua sp.]